MDREKIFTAAEEHNHKRLKELLSGGIPSRSLHEVLSQSLLIACGSRALYDMEASPACRNSKSLDFIIQLLIARGADINSKGFEQRTPLHYAAHFFPYNVKTLIDIGADVNASTSTGWTSLMSVPASSARLLLEAGADPNAANNAGETALHHCRSTTKAKLLFEYGAHLDARTLSGQTAMMYAAKKGRLSMVRWFCHDPELIEKVDAEGNDSLLIAAQAGKPKIVRLLLRCGRNPHFCNKDGQDLLISSCRTDCPELVALALERGCDSNHQDNRGYTALMYCVDCGFEKSISLLLGAGADPSLKNEAGENAFSLADVPWRSSVSRLLGSYP